MNDWREPISSEAYERMLTATQQLGAAWWRSRQIPRLIDMWKPAR